MAAADQTNIFFPKVGTELGGLSTISIDNGSNAKNEIKFNAERTIVDNDGLTTKLTIKSRLISGNANQTVDSPDNYAVYRSYMLVEQSSVSMNPTTSQAQRFWMIYDCDKAAIQSFLPLGRVASVQVPCTVTTRLGENSHSDQIVFSVSYEGKSQTTTSAGTFSVENIRLVGSSASTKVDTLELFDTSKSLLVSVHTATTIGAMHSDSLSELTSVTH